MKHTRIFVVFFLLFGSFAFFAGVPAFPQNSETPRAKNVIYFVGDGMGFNNYIAASYWKSGQRGQEVLDSFPVLVGMSTFALRADVEIPEDLSKGYDPKTAWKDGMSRRSSSEFSVVTDSGAAGTALFSGVKTINGRIGMDAAQNSVKLLPEYAAERGRSCGTVVSIMISHATPACWAAHTKNRGDYSGIFNQMLNESPLSVLMGTGHPFYQKGRKLKFGTDDQGKEKKPNYQFLGGAETWEWMQNASEDEEHFLFVDSAEDFRRLSQANFTIPDKVVGVAREVGLLIPVDGAPDLPEARGLLEKNWPDADYEELPTLAEMTESAITLLSRNENGFVLMVEGSNMDAANHRRDIAKSVMEATSFLRAIEKTVRWVENYSSWDETLIIVTADHETGDLWGPGSYEDENNNRQYDKDEVFHGLKKIVNNGRGQLPGVQYLYGSHSNQIVPLWAKGTGAELLEKKVRGIDAEAAELFREVKTPSNDFHGQYIDNIDVVPAILEVMR